MWMNTLRPLIAAAVLLVAGATALAADKPSRAEKNEARLEQLLKGRTAGTPVSCIPSFQADKLEVIEGLAMVYGSGDTLYVARPKNSQSLRWEHVPQTTRASVRRELLDYLGAAVAGRAAAGLPAWL
jgi:hypothetical protein